MSNKKSLKGYYLITFLIGLGFFVWYLGNKIYMKIQREQRNLDIENVAYDEIKKEIRKMINGGNE